MLRKDEIKSLVEFAEDFDIDGRYILTPYNKAIRIEHLDVHKTLYPLFLNRVKQGMNKSANSKYRIDILASTIFVIDIAENKTIATWEDSDWGMANTLRYVLAKGIYEEA